MKRKNSYNTVSLILILTIAVNMLALFPIEPSQAQGPTMTFTTGETIDINSNDYIDFWSNVSMTFTSGIQVQFVDLDGDGMLEPCDVIMVVFPPQFIMEYCSWWEVLYPNGQPTGFEFHIDQQYGPNEFHVDMVWPGPFPLPVPGGINLAEKKISVIELCEWYVVHWPSGWYPAPCSWWEIIDPETQHPTGYEFHVDVTNESCEFHIDDVTPGPYILPFPWHQIEARKKISQITPCDWFTIITGTVPEPNSWWEIMYQGQATGLEFHVDQSNSTTGLFHVDAVLPSNPLNMKPTYPTTARRKISSIEPCTWLKVADPASTPQPCTWWKITNPVIGDYEFHVDQSNQDGTFHVDLVYPSTIPITPAADTVIAEKKITTIGSCDWFKVITGGLPQPCSWWTITSPAEWTGVVFHVDSTDGISKFHIDQADTLPPGPTPPPWSVTAEEYTPPDPWYWKPEQRDYAPSGVPDFDQRQWGTYMWQDMAQQWSHCGPVAVANSLWWLDSEFEPNPMPQPIINDGFPLVQAYGQWDDHDPQNVPWLVEHLAYLMDTDGRRTGLIHSGTNVNDMQAGLTHYLSWTGVNPLGDVNGDGMVDQTDFNIVSAAMGSTPWQGPWDLRADIFPASTTYPPVADNVIDAGDLGLVMQNMGQTGMFYEHTVMQPDFFFIEEEVKRCQDVVLLVGYWVYDPTGGGWYREPGGHYVTVAGVDSTNIKLALSDPVQDAFESGLIPEGRIPVPHVHPPGEPPYITHNDAQYVSQDIYDVTEITPPWPPCPGGNWMLMNFASWRPAPPFFAVIESAVITSPLGEHDVAVVNVTTSKDGCRPMLTVCRNYTARINVTVLNEGVFTENFTLTAHANATVIGTTNVVNLAPGLQTIVTFLWNTSGYAYGNYTISAQATGVVGETDTADNTFVDGTILVTGAGDINGDAKCDGKDISRMAKAFGTRPGQPVWDTNADINDDDKVDGKDISIAAKYFGTIYLYP